METSDKEMDWDRIEEKIPDEHLTGEATETDLPVCPHCDSDIQEDDETITWELEDESAVIHRRYAESIWRSDIENPFWFDTFTAENYEATADYLRSLECVGEVLTNNGRMYGVWRDVCSY